MKKKLIKQMHKQGQKAHLKCRTRGHPTTIKSTTALHILPTSTKLLNLSYTINKSINKIKLTSFVIGLLHKKNKATRDLIVIAHTVKKSSLRTTGEN
jgi:predicted flavoprotein YhiN